VTLWSDSSVGGLQDVITETLKRTGSHSNESTTLLHYATMQESNIFETHTLIKFFTANFVMNFVLRYFVEDL